MTRIIGIDYGTSTTVVRVHNTGLGDRVVPVCINGQRTIPTIAFCQANSKEMYYGYDAEAKISSNIEGITYKNFKMDLISEDVQKRGQAEFLTQGFMRYVYDNYNKSLNDGCFAPADEVKVYVSHPAKWNSSARTFMKQCVANAGFCHQQNIFLKDEPTAALLAVIHEKNFELRNAQMLHDGQKYKAMMIDMGAGTTDIVLCSYMIENGVLNIDDIFTYPSISAQGLCGGREIDDAIIWEAEKFINSMQENPSRFADKVLDKLRKNGKKWKETVVSTTLQNNQDLPEPDLISEFRDTLKEFGLPVRNENERFGINRDSFEQFTIQHWKNWGDLLWGAFNEVRNEQYNELFCPKEPEEVNLLIITGGHSQWYIVKDYLSGSHQYNYLPDINFKQIRENKNLLIQSSDPQETVSVGLCYMDEDIVGTIAASNSVSINFTCEGNYLGACNLINKGVPLPFEKNDFRINNNINGNFIFRRELDIKYSIITDECNIIEKSLTVPSDGIISTILKAVFSLLGIAILDIPRTVWYFMTGNLDKLDDTVLEDIINNQYAVELRPNIQVTEEGIIKVGGSIIIDDEQLNIPEITI